MTAGNTIIIQEKSVSCQSHEWVPISAVAAIRTSMSSIILPLHSKLLFISPNMSIIDRPMSIIANSSAIRYVAAKLFSTCRDFLARLFKKKEQSCSLRITTIKQEELRKSFSKSCRIISLSLWPHLTGSTTVSSC